MAIVKNQEYKDRNLEFLEEYSQRPGVKTLHNGVMYKVIVKGNGVKPSPKSMVTVHYKGSLINGKVFDTSLRGGKAPTFKLSQLIDGWRSALREMPAGSRWEFVVPFNLGYGARGSGSIKPYSTLIFDIQLLAVLS